METKMDEGSNCLKKNGRVRVNSELVSLNKLKKRRSKGVI